MSETKLISPLLDNFIMGDPISEHHGIRCCPAMDQQTQDKYIVKIISLPPSQTQLDALLLTGALSDKDAAQKYYEDRANEIVRELETLQNLSRQEGFLPCAGFQAVPMEDETGYDVYILANYKRSLEKQFVKQPLTQLDALNFGLDICAALNACRRSGYLFINLKPSNIYVTMNGEYKISDLGFVSLKALKYATIPDHYIGTYTPPEIKDAFSSISQTTDVYALGMILYQIYNGGELPVRSEEPLTAPKYADEELSQIILKACSFDPEERWQTPAEMGQMLVSYMQKNGASDAPIVPAAEPEPEETISEEEPVTEDHTESADTESTQITDNSEEPEAIDEAVTEADVPGEDVADSADEETAEEAPADEAVTEETAEVITEAEEASAITEQAQEATIEEPEEEIIVDTQDISYDEVSEEVSQILSQADELAAMDVPEPVVAPEPIEIVLPVNEESEEWAEEADEETEEPAEDPEDTELEELEEEEINQPDPPKKSHWLRNLLLTLMSCAIIAGGVLFYLFYVQKNVEQLKLVGSKDQLTVFVVSDANEEDLTVTCTDIYGKTVTVPVVDSKAEFSGLLANTGYTVSVQIKGLHLLDGQVTSNYFTPEETAFVQCSVVTGSTPGTAILNFTITGPDSENWIFSYSTQGEEVNSVTFAGHTLTITDLEEHKVYTGTLAPEDDLFIAQPQQITFTASEIIQANNLFITGCYDGKLSAEWSAPESVNVESWTVRCYNGTDYDQTITTQETSAVFENLNSASSFTVEVTAVGQSVCQRATVGENSVTVMDLAADTSVPGIINLSWNSSAAVENWIVSYTVNNSELVLSTTSTENKAIIQPAIPGAKYTISIRSSDPSATVCAPFVCETPEAQDFTVNYSGNVIERSNLQFFMCERPSGSSWTHKDVTSYTTTFAAGTNAAFVIFLNRTYDVSYEDVVAAFVITDENGQIVSITSSTEAWSNMWYKNYCELDIPTIPENPGNYNICIYFNGMFVTNQSFSVA